MVDAFDRLDLIQEVIKKPRFGLFTDVDGTISRIVPTPEQATVSQKCRHYLSVLTSRLTLVAAISGRPSSKIEKMIGIRGIVYVGNHGLERLSKEGYEITQEVKGYAGIIRAALKQLGPVLSSEGIIVEDKGVTASIHYRLSQEPEQVKTEILTAIKNLPQSDNLRTLEGKMVVNLLPKIEASKGTATLELIKSYKLEGGIYLGDDQTDIDAFKAIHTAKDELDFQGLALGVISRETSRELILKADLTLNGVGEVERFLGWMVENLKPN